MERRVELTSGAWIQKPEQLFWITGQINKDRPNSEQIGVELYPVNYLGGVPIGPGRIKAESVREWQREYGNVPIERIHLPFHWSITSASKRFITSFFREQGTLKDRWTAMKVAVATGTLMNRYALGLANDLDAGANAHTFIIEQAEKARKIDLIKDSTRYVWVENDLDYGRKKDEDIAKARNPLRAVGAVERNGLEGVIMGIDHAYGYGVDPREDFENPEVFSKLTKHLKCLHLAGDSADHEAGHGLIREDDKDFWGFVDYIKEKTFDNNLVFCLDLNPFEMRHLTSAQQLDYIKRLVANLEK